MYSSQVLLTKDFVIEKVALGFRILLSIFTLFVCLKYKVVRYMSVCMKEKSDFHGICLLST